MEETNSKLIALMQKDIEYIKEHQALNKKEADERHLELMKAIKEVSENKANKWVEKAMIGGITFILIAVGTALLALVISTPQP